MLVALAPQSNLLRYNTCHTPPEITPISSPSFPRIGVDKCEVVRQTWISVFGLIMFYICESCQHFVNFMNDQEGK
jgi:hypothetical protein